MSRRRHGDDGDGVSVVNSIITGPNIQIRGSVTGNVTINARQTAYHLRWLVPEQPDAWVPDRRRAPSFLLDARSEVVPFRPRPLEQDWLRDWRDSSATPASVLLVHGAGGRGKTRLANAFARESHGFGWSVAEATRHPADDQMVTGVRQSGSVEHTGVVVVVDYAERWEINHLVELITDLVSGSVERPVRVLLLARSTADLWDPLVDDLDRLPVDLPDPLELPDFTDDPGERRAAFEQAALAFRQAPSVGDLPHQPPPADLDHESYGSPLTLQMAALAAVCATAAGESPPARDDLSRYLLRHERRLWPLEGISRSQASDSVFLATLFGPLADDTTAHGLLRPARLVDGDAAARQLLRWHERMYPNGASAGSPPGQGAPPALPPLRPDRFGEDFVAEQFAADARAVSTLAALAEAGVPDGFAWRRCLIVLTAVVDRHNQHRDTLWTLLGAHPHLAFNASATLIRAVTSHAPRDLAVAFSLALPTSRTDLLRPSADLIHHLLQTMPADDSDGTRGRLLYTLSGLLADLGDPDGALVAIRDAVEAVRNLVNQDRPARGDTSSTPAERTHLRRLGIALGDCGARQHDLGDLAAAIQSDKEATAIFQRLTQHDRATHEQYLASTLDNLGVHAAKSGDELGGFKYARQALDIFQRLARSGRGDHLAAWALSLNNIANRELALQRHTSALDHARKSYEIRQRLANADPATFLPDMAMSLLNLAIMERDMGRGANAVTLADEAVQTYRLLAEQLPARFTGNLVDAVTNMVHNQHAIDQHPSVADTVRDCLAFCQEQLGSENVALSKLCTHLDKLYAGLVRLVDEELPLDVAHELVELIRWMADLRIGDLPATQTNFTR